jgi:hypothetical protein
MEAAEVVDRPPADEASIVSHPVKAGIERRRRRWLRAARLRGVGWGGSDKAAEGDEGD